MPKEEEKITVEELKQIFNSIERGNVAGREDTDTHNICWGITQQIDEDGDITATININKWQG